MKERPIQEYYDKAQELAINTQCLYYYREYVARGMQYQEAVTKQEMIDKACSWLESHFRDIENPDFYSKRNHPTDLESMYHWSVKELVDDFRKTMEERHGED